MCMLALCILMPNDCGVLCGALQCRDTDQKLSSPKLQLPTLAWQSLPLPAPPQGSLHLAGRAANEGPLDVSSIVVYTSIHQEQYNRPAPHMESSLHAPHWLRHLPRLPLIQPGCRAKPFSPCFRILLSSKRSLTSYLSAYESFLLRNPQLCLH